jgi:hypothetical protein
VRRYVGEVDDRAVAGVDLGDLPALGVEDGGALTQRRALEVGGQLVEALDGVLRDEAQATGRGQASTLTPRNLAPCWKAVSPPPERVFTMSVSLRSQSPDRGASVRLS